MIRVVLDNKGYASGAARATNELLLRIPPLWVALWLVSACHTAGNSHNGDADSGLGDSDSARDVDAGPETVDMGLVINEVMSKNDGVLLDEALETEDWIEILNTGDTALDLSDFILADDTSQAWLPDAILAAGEIALFFADGDRAQGPSHLPFKLSAAGDRVYLRHRDGRVADRVILPALPPNESLARLPDGGSLSRCRYATPGRPNGPACTPPRPRGLDTVYFEPFAWPARFPAPEGGVVINEAGLNPPGFIEIANTGDAARSLDGVTIDISPHGPGLPWPGPGAGRTVPLDAVTLAPGDYLSVRVRESDVAELAADPLFEGVVTLFDAEGAVLDRVDFMQWPNNARLAREPDGAGGFRYCTNETPGAENTCRPLDSRPVGDRLRYLRCASDFDALARGGAKFGIGSVKFVVDLEGGSAVHLLSSAVWPLHYAFVRELIDGEPRLDRCDPEENILFNRGWTAFSQQNYYATEGRRYLLGTLSHHGGADLRCVEYTFGDAASPAQMAEGFFAAAAHTLDPTAWHLRPQDAQQVENARQIEGTLPIVGPAAPFADVTFQPLTEGVGYGYLTFLTTDTLRNADLGPDKIVVLDDVPNDIPFVGGLITEAFQTPLSHVNILSRSRNTPNMALVGAREDAAVAPYEGKLVRLEVLPTHFKIAEASPVEAAAHWDALMPRGPTRVIPRDLTVLDLVPLDGTVGLELASAIGVKAAQLSELFRVDPWTSGCDDLGDAPLSLPRSPFAIPVAHYAAHFEASGGAGLIRRYLDDPAFLADPAVRDQGLAAVREAVMTHPVDSALLDAVSEAVSERFGQVRVRFRSSSTAEDLSDFNGAGLYTSVSAELGDPERTIADAIRTVWAGLWNQRAHDERTHANMDHASVTMGVLVHEAFLSEEANGVAVSRDVGEPDRGDRCYVNVQAGEASVTNPAPGVSSEEFVYQWPSRVPTLRVSSESSLVPGPVLQNRLHPGPVYRYGEIEGETRALVCALRSVHHHFQGLLDPDRVNPWFAMEVEFKLTHETRDLVIKQARPYSFGRAEMPADCRSY